jgi:Flp pilus assembly protein TadD
LAAQAQVGEILKSAPQYVPALMVKALLAENKPDPAVAEATYEEVLTQYPDFVPALKKLASLYAQTPATNDKAYALAVKARKALPADAEVARTLGIVVFRRGDFSQAASLLLESARQRSEDAELRYYLGMAQYRLKNRTESKVSLQRALDLKLSGPEAAEARQVLAELK